MSTEAYFERDGVRKRIIADRAKALAFGKYGYTCCGHARVFGRRIPCDADLLLVDDEPPYFRETMRDGDNRHVAGCDHENTNEVEYSDERRYMNRLMPVDSFRNLHEILLGEDHNNNGGEGLNRNDNHPNGPHRRIGNGPDAEIRNVLPNKIMDYFNCLMNGIYTGDKNDFLYLDNIDDYLKGATRLEGEKIVMCRRYGGFDPEIANTLGINGLRKDNTFWFQDPFKRKNHVIMILSFDNDRIPEFQLTKDNDIFVDYKKGKQIVDNNGAPRWHGPYYVIYANWQSYVVTTAKGLIQVAIGSFVSRKQVMHFGNEDLAVIKDNLEKWNN